MKFRVWYVENPPSPALRLSVEGVEHGKKVLKALFDAALADPAVEVNAGGLEVKYEPDDERYFDGEWEEYYDEEDRDVLEIMDEDEGTPTYRV